MEESRSTDNPAHSNSSAIGDQPTDAELLTRFVDKHEKSAFELLVRRHSPMVMGVCRRVLGDAHEAEDAFQATFMVLLRKSKSIGRPELLANWLYGVAFRIARKARNKAARQQPRECGDMFAPPDPYREPEWLEVKTLLDEELQQLPAKLRMPLVLCYLDGKTNIEAARLLGCPDGSIANRLSVARAELKKRLLRRGMVLSSALLAVFLNRQTASAGVPETLVEETLRGSANHFAQLAQTPTRALADASKKTNEPVGPMADIPLAECRPPSFVEQSKRKRLPKAKRFLQSVLWLLLFSWIVLPISDLCGGSLAGAARGVQNAWTVLLASRNLVTRGQPDGTNFAGVAAGFENSVQGLPMEMMAENDERCKRCLGTNCRTEDSDPLAIRLQRSVLQKLFFWR